MHGAACGEEGLKRVCSAPQLGDQDKASLLKRKLSVSDTEPCLVDRGSNKYKKQGRKIFCFFCLSWLELQSCDCTIKHFFCVCV